MVIQNRFRSYGAISLLFAAFCMIMAAGPGAGGAEEESDSRRGRGRFGSRAGTARARFGSDRLTLTFGKASTEGDEGYAKIAGLKPGEVVKFYRQSALKLKTAASLVFGEDCLVKRDNITAGFDGLYSVWIRADKDDKWSLVFNEDVDVFGTMYEVEKSVAEVPLAHKKAEKFAKELDIVFKEVEGEKEKYTLEILWGDHHWSVAMRAAG